MKTEDKNKALMIAIDALTKIANPIQYLQVKAASEGASLNGAIAVQLSKDPDYLSGIAKSALYEINDL